MKYLFIWVIGCALLLIFLFSNTSIRSFIIYYPKSEFSLEVFEAKCANEDKFPEILAFNAKYKIYHKGRIGGSWRSIRTDWESKGWYKWELADKKISPVQETELSDWVDCYPFTIGLVRSLETEVGANPFIQAQALSIRDKIDDGTFLFGYYNNDINQYYAVEFDKLGIPSPKEFDIKLF